MDTCNIDQFEKKKYFLNHRKNKMKTQSIWTLVTAVIYTLILAGCSSTYSPTTYINGSAYFQGVKTRLEEGADINGGTNENADTFLHISVLNNNAGEVKYLLKKGAKPNQKNKAGLPPIYYINANQKPSTDKAQAEIISLLAQHGADIDIKMKDGITALTAAILENRPFSVKALLKADADVSIQYKNNTPLMLAVQTGNIDIVDALLTKQQKFNIQNPKGQTALHFTALKQSKGTDKSQTLIAKHLIEAGAKLPRVYRRNILSTAIANKRPLVAKTLMNAIESGDNPNRDYFSPLMNAVHDGDIGLVRELLKSSPDINFKDKNGWAALHLTAHKESKGGNWQQKRIANLLIKSGADVNLQGPNNNTALNIAISNDKKGIAATLLDENAETDIKNSEGENALMKAVQAGYFNMLEDIISSKNTNDQDNYGWTSLHFASSAETNLEKEQRFEIIEFLLEFGANINQQNNNGYSALELAIESDFSDIAHLLLTNKADIDIQNHNGQTALMLAAKQGNVALVKSILTIPQNLDVRDNNGWTALHFAANSIATRNDHDAAEITQLLINAGANTNLQTTNHDSALHLSVERNHLEVTKILSNSGTDASLKNDQDLTPLMLAVQHGNYPITKILVQQPQNFDTKQNNGWTALHLTAHIDSEGSDSTQAKIANAIIAAGANINSQITTGETTLSIAIGNDHPEVAEVLLNAGAKTDIIDSNGWTPLMLAVYLGKIDIVRQALKLPSNLNTRNSDGLTALHLTANSSSYGGDKLQAQIAKLLLNAGANVNSKAIEGSTALHFAAASGRIAVAKALLAAKASRRLRNLKGWNARDEATKANNTAIVSLLK